MSVFKLKSLVKPAIISTYFDGFAIKSLTKDGEPTMFQCGEITCNIIKKSV